jgi:hypothetical protein
MPDAQFVTDARKRGVSPHGCLHLAERYDVSLTATLNRISALVERGSGFAALLWAQSGGPEVHWSVPSYARRIQHTPGLMRHLQRAAAKGTEVNDQVSINDGRKRRSWWLCSTMLSSGLILTTALRGRGTFSFRAVPQRPAEAPATREMTEQLAFWILA